ncbi:MAG: hypothetical protein GY866_37900, partial [Proteobacteria bacterium]|nr:hypothetical protein [Pseudomonadota bacterium]
MKTRFKAWLARPGKFTVSCCFLVVSIFILACSSAQKPVVESIQPAPKPVVEPAHPAEKPAVEPALPAQKPVAEPVPSAQKPVVEPVKPAQKPVAESVQPAEDSPRVYSLPRAQPREIGLSSENLNELSAYLKMSVKRGRFPGAVALMARHGKIGYFESFGT